MSNLKPVFFFFVFSILSVLGTSMGIAADKPAITIEDVNFEDPKISDAGEWVEIGIFLKAQRGTSTRNPKFVDNIKVSFSCGYETPDGPTKYQFFTSSAKIATLEISKVAAVHFYIPPEIRERDRLGKTPFAWLIEISIDDVVLDLTEKNVAKKLRKREHIENFKKMVAEGADQNEGIMVPIYDTFFWGQSDDSRRLKYAPAYVIKPRSGDR